MSFFDSLNKNISNITAKANKNFSNVSENLNNRSAISSAKKTADYKREEKKKVFGYIGMEVYDMYLSGAEISIPKLEIYFNNLKQLDQEIQGLEKEIEMRNISAAAHCTKCGSPVDANAGVCPNCGYILQNTSQSPVQNAQPVQNQFPGQNTVPPQNMQAVPNPYAEQNTVPAQNMQPVTEQNPVSVEEPVQKQSPVKLKKPVQLTKKLLNKQSDDSSQIETSVKECICGAKIEPGQTMCLNCGRMIEG